MKKKDLVKLREETIESLTKKAHVLKSEIARMILDWKSNPPKNTNQISNKKRELANVLTILRQKQLTI
ncbi:50S ribosomal protein L29 [Candidatus Roizmanbacteria bacterium RIFCSPHIGHO2_02_FULL_40_13b]|nr:MAG: 50S ribosomal protein L29 [Candidatus Roizmanbacteria bacterium RIFCSPHIGHO2_02_FULL_40_13b]